jgi:PhnB protein
VEGSPEHNLLAQIFVAGSDAVFAQAVKAGANESCDRNVFLAHRRAPARSIRQHKDDCTHKENVSVEEMQRRLNALASPSAASAKKGLSERRSIPIRIKDIEKAAVRV